MKNDILNLIKQNGCEIDEELKIAADLLVELARSKKENGDINHILNWLEEKRRNYIVNTQEVGINQLDKWNIHPDTGIISHETGKFFSIIGVKIEGASNREVVSWTQPMMKQNECGILGILCKKINGVMHYLLQAKFEPGNRKILQLSPTLQATDSNLKLAHKGKKPFLAEYFENGGKGKKIIDVESVEDGGRFYLKTNRNMIIEIDKDEEINVPDNFIWINTYQLKKLIKEDLAINSLVRSILGSV